MFDTLAVFRAPAAGVLNADAQSTGIDVGVGGTPRAGLSVVVKCPTRPTDSDETLQVVIQTSVDNSTWRNRASFNIITQALVPAASQGKPAGAMFVQRFATKDRYVRLDYDVEGTTPDFGLVEAWLTKDAYQKEAGAY
jgi:hypothetical protein